MRLLVATLCGAALLAGTVQANANDRRGHSGHMRVGVAERHGGPSVSVRIGERGTYGHRSPSRYAGFYGYGPSYGYTSYGPAYGYRSTYYGGSRYYDDAYGYGYGYVGYRRSDDDCD